MDTKWNETIKSINKKENFKSNITNNDVLILENKLKKINQKKINQKKTLTKLPLLENIYESFETKEGMENNVEVFTKSTPLLVPHNKIGEIYLKSNIAISYTIKINSVQANDIHENQLLCIIKDTNGVFNSENLQQSIGIFSKIIKNNGKTYIDFFYVKDGSIEKLTSENDVELENNANIKLRIIISDNKVNIYKIKDQNETHIIQNKDISYPSQLKTGTAYIYTSTKLERSGESSIVSVPEGNMSNLLVMMSNSSITRNSVVSSENGLTSEAGELLDTGQDISNSLNKLSNFEFKKDFCEDEFLDELERLGFITRDEDGNVSEFKEPEKYNDIKHPDGSKSCSKGDLKLFKGDIVKLKVDKKKKWKVIDIADTKITIETIQEYTYDVENNNIIDNGEVIQQANEQLCEENSCEYNNDDEIEKITMMRTIEVNESELERATPFEITKIFKYIRYIPKCFYVLIAGIDYIQKKTISIFCDAITIASEPITEKDKRLVISEYYNLVYLFIIVFITYNLFYIWCFQDKDGNYVPLKNFNEEFLNAQSNYSSQSEMQQTVQKIFNFFFEFLMFPIFSVDTIFSRRDAKFEMPPPFGFFGKIPYSFPSILEYIIRFFSTKQIANIKWYFLFFVLYFNRKKLTHILNGYAEGKDWRQLIFLLFAIGIISKSIPESWLR